MVKSDNWSIDRSLSDKSTKIGKKKKRLLPYIEYRLIKYQLSIEDERQNPRWPSLNSVFFTFPVQTAVISLFVI